MEKIYKLENPVFYISLIFLIVLMGLGFIAYPAVDDYEYALKSIEKGFWNSQVYEYLNWNGRYIATAILSFNPLTWRWYFGYHLIPMLLIIGLVYSLYYFLRTLLPSVDAKKMGKATVVVVSVYLMRHFALDQNIFWMSGSITYTLPIILELVFFSLLYQNILAKRTNIRSTLLIILSFVIIGLNETVMIAHCFLLFMVAVYFLLKKRTIPSDILLLLPLSFIFSLMVILAPGNSVRASRFERSHDLVFTLTNSITYSIIYTIKFLSPVYIVLFLLFRKIIRKHIEVFELGQSSKFNLRFIVIVVFGLLYLTMAPSLWGMGRRPNDRTLNMVMIYYQVLFPFLALQLSYKFEKTKNKITVSFDKLKFIPLCVLLIASFSFYNPYLVAKDAITKLPRYLSIMEKRFEKIHGDKKENLQFDYLQEEEMPRTIMFKDIDEKFLKIQKYYGLKNAKLIK